MRLSHTLALAASATAAAAAWDCKIDKWDLTPLAGVKRVTHDLDTPPSTTRRIVRLNLCDVLGKEDKVADEDQCAGDVQACMQVVSVKKGQDDRYIQAVPLWDKDSPAPKSGDASEKGFNLALESGHKYAGIQQRTVISMICDPDAGDDTEPKFVGYAESAVEHSSLLSLEWRSKAACPRDDIPDGGDGGSDEPAPSSGGGFFHTLSVIFWFLVLGLLAYFVLGALYNYQNYGARGSDLIPHRDFWREVPALAQDLGSHLFNNVRQTSSRGGYSSLG